jgi:hypothetical protein
LPDKAGTLAVGDAIQVLERRPHPKES